MSKQVEPKKDNRYRVSRSVRCYVAELMCGIGFCTWYFQNSVERTVYVGKGGREYIVYKNRYYRLQTPVAMERIVKGHLADRGCVNIAGLAIYYDGPNNDFTPFHFIDITLKEERENYKRLRPIWIQSNQ